MVYDIQKSQNAAAQMDKLTVFDGYILISHSVQLYLRSHIYYSLSPVACFPKKTTQLTSRNMNLVCYGYGSVHRILSLDHLLGKNQSSSCRCRHSDGFQ